jgi:hypothetical protein
MSKAVNPLAVTVGTKCNIRCRHCLVDKDLGADAISKDEIQLVVSEINKYSPDTILLTGGEPTLFIEEIQQIISGIDSSLSPKLKLITNAHFAETTAAAVKVLRSIKGLAGVIVSYDKFHAEFVTGQNIINLLDACDALKIGAGIACAIEAPMDLTFLNSIKRPGLAISVQQILPLGHAKEHSLEYRYPFFDPGVLGKKCPNLGGMVYNCGSGFTVCCGPLASSPSKSRYIHGTIAEHFQSEFYSIVSERTFGEMAELSGIKVSQFLPAHSSPCQICSLLVPKILNREPG